MPKGKGYSKRSKPKTRSKTRSKISMSSAIAKMAGSLPNVGPLMARAAKSKKKLPPLPRGSAVKKKK